MNLRHSFASLNLVGDEPATHSLLSVGLYVLCHRIESYSLFCGCVVYDFVTEASISPLVHLLVKPVALTTISSLTSDIKRKDELQPFWREGKQNVLENSYGRSSFWMFICPDCTLADEW